MSINIGILNCYSDEPESAPSASHFKKFIPRADIVNICHNIKVSDINNYNGFIISGSRSSHKDNADWINYLEKLIRQIYLENIPCLAVCFGHQLVAKVFGGKTVLNQYGENGFQNVPTKYSNYKIELFYNLPNPVKIYQSHNDAVIKSPPGSLNTINNEKCVQYFQYGAIHSMQSHPEISVSIAIKIAKRDNQDVALMLNGVNDENVKSHIVLNNFIKIIEQTRK